jgi:hypothetical protein
MIEPRVWLHLVPIDINSPDLIILNMQNESMPEAQATPEEEKLTPESAAELTRAGRVPIWELAISVFEEKEKTGMMFHTPPKGTQFGDQCERRHSGVYVFTGPKGEYRGTADSEWLVFQEGRIVRRAIEDTLRGEGRDTSGSLSYFLRRVRRRIAEGIF